MVKVGFINQNMHGDLFVSMVHRKKRVYEKEDSNILLSEWEIQESEAFEKDTGRARGINAYGSCEAAIGRYFIFVLQDRDACRVGESTMATV